MQALPGNGMVQFLAIAEHGMCLFAIEYSPQLNDQNYLLHDVGSFVSPAYIKDPKAPWYRLCAGTKGQRVMWITQAQTYQDEPIYEKSPQLVLASIESKGRAGALDSSGRIPSSFLQTSLEQHINCTGDLSVTPALWAFPQIDFDEALGLVAIGNIFGELALYDLVGLPLCGMWSLSLDIPPLDIPPSFKMISTVCTYFKSVYAMQTRFCRQDPVPLIPHPVVPSTLTHRRQDLDYDPSLTDHWTPIDLTDLTLPYWTRWQTSDWSDWSGWNEWLGSFPGNSAWLLEHAYGFLGEPHPLAFDYRSRQVVVRAGGLYILMDYDNDLGHSVCSFPSDMDPREIVLNPPSAYYGSANESLEGTLEAPKSQGAYLEGLRYECMMRKEMRGGRNRWVEQMQRGGQPHENLLVMVEERYEPPLILPDISMLFTDEDLAEIEEAMRDDGERWRDL
jgi:hypothetical protein